MANDSPDADRHFEDVVRDLKREHHGRRHGRARYSRPRTMAELEQRRLVRWVLAIVVALGLAVAIAFLIPT
jgi:hypothetical protein